MSTIKQTLKRPLSENEDSVSNKRHKPVVIDSAFCNMLRKDLSALAEKYGLLSIELGNIKYTANSLKASSFTAYALTYNEDGTVKCKEQLKWEKHCKSYGFKPEDWGKTFTMSCGDFKGKEVSLFSIERKNKKYKIVTKFVSTDGTLSMTEESALKEFKQSEPIKSKYFL